LLAEEGPLLDGEAMPVPTPLPILLEYYANDIGRFERLRERNADLQNWVKLHCLKGD
jgi:hypothetical protein